METGQVRAVISTGDIARDGAIIDPAGWDFSNYLRNPVVLWMHDDTSAPFARCINIIAGESELIAQAQFDLDDPRGVEMLRKIKNNYINATSVRWLPKREPEVLKQGEGDDRRYVLVYRQQELLEFSFVTIPADPKALIIRADGRPLDVSEYLPKPEPELEPEPEPAPVPTAAIGAAVASYAARRMRRASIDDLIVRGLARATGKTEQRIRLGK